jgi:hypothetical protein
LKCFPRQPAEDTAPDGGSTGGCKAHDIGRIGQNTLRHLEEAVVFFRRRRGTARWRGDTAPGRQVRSDHWVSQYHQGDRDTDVLSRYEHVLPVTAQHAAAIARVKPQSTQVDGLAERPLAP